MAVNTKNTKPCDDEYKLLKGEITNIQNMRHQTISILYTVTAAILAFALNNKEESLLFLVPFCVILPTYLMVITQSNDIVKIGAYLKVFHEGGGYQWETHINNFNLSKKNTKRRFANSFTLPFLILSAMSLALFAINFDWKHIDTLLSIIKLIMALICASAVLIIRLIIQKDIDKLKRPYIEKWEEVKQRGDVKP